MKKKLLAVITTIFASIGLISCDVTFPNETGELRDLAELITDMPLPTTIPSNFTIPSAWSGTLPSEWSGTIPEEWSSYIPTEMFNDLDPALAFLALAMCNNLTIYHTIDGYNDEIYEYTDTGYHLSKPDGYENYYGYIESDIVYTERIDYYDCIYYTESLYSTLYPVTKNQFFERYGLIDIIQDIQNDNDNYGGFDLSQNNDGSIVASKYQNGYLNTYKIYNINQTSINYMSSLSEIKDNLNIANYEDNLDVLKNLLDDANNNAYKLNFTLTTKDIYGNEKLIQTVCNDYVLNRLFADGVNVVNETLFPVDEEWCYEKEAYIYGNSPSSITVNRAYPGEAEYQRFSVLEITENFYDYPKKKITYQNEDVEYIIKLDNLSYRWKTDMEIYELTIGSSTSNYEIKQEWLMNVNQENNSFLYQLASYNSASEYTLIDYGFENDKIIRSLGPNCYIYNYTSGAFKNSYTSLFDGMEFYSLNDSNGVITYEKGMPAFNTISDIIDSFYNDNETGILYYDSLPVLEYSYNELSSEFNFTTEDGIDHLLRINKYVSTDHTAEEFKIQYMIQNGELDGNNTFISYVQNILAAPHHVEISGNINLTNVTFENTNIMYYINDTCCLYSDNAAYNSNFYYSSIIDENTYSYNVNGNKSVYSQTNKAFVLANTTKNNISDFYISGKYAYLDVANTYFYRIEVELLISSKVIYKLYDENNSLVGTIMVEQYNSNFAPISDSELVSYFE